MNMERIKKLFDDFTFHARVMPIIVISIPILVVGILGGVIRDNWFENSIWLFIGIALLTITSKVARNLGKDFEEKMYKQLGEKPTTIILRFSDDKLDTITKQRYHKRLNEFDGLELPLDKSSETLDDDEQYSSAANFLRNYANSNRDKEPRVYQELKEYNFWRNLYGTKIIALSLYFLIAVREVILAKEFNVLQIFLHPYPNYIALLFILVSMFFVALFINKKAVNQKGFDYAKALIEVCERISVDKRKAETVID